MTSHTHGIQPVKTAGRVAVPLIASVLVIAAASVVSAQRGGGAAAPAPPPQSPRAGAPIDLTGYWVAIVNEDWRWRMVTPVKGDVSSVPVTPEARKAAESWDPATDGSCLAYGAAGLMRMPMRLNITWENDTTLKIEIDAGQQMRRLFFDKSAAVPAQRSLQGFSLAEWERVGGGGRGGRGGFGGPPGPGGGAPAGPGGAGRGGPDGGGGAPAARGGNLKVVTTNLSGGWLRKNGVPYSENATMTEFFDRFPVGTDQWLVVTTLVSDTRYLAQEFVTSSHFRREADASKWSPAPCRPT